MNETMRRLVAELNFSIAYAAMNVTCVRMPAG